MSEEGLAWHAEPPIVAWFRNRSPPVTPRVGPVAAPQGRHQERAAAENGSVFVLGQQGARLPGRAGPVVAERFHRHPPGVIASRIRGAVSGI